MPYSPRYTLAFDRWLNVSASFKGLPEERSLGHNAPVSASRVQLAYTLMRIIYGLGNILATPPSRGHGA